MRRLVLSLVALLASACASHASCAPSGDSNGAAATPAARTELTEDELTALREVVSGLAPGTRRAGVIAALAGRLDGLPVQGTGPRHEATEIYVLGKRNVLWLTWDRRDPDDIVLRRAAVWNEATDPTPSALPYPPPNR